MQPALTSLRGPAGLMRRHMTKVVVKINLAIALLSEICNFRFLRVPNNPSDSTGMLNVDEGVMHVDNGSKILQRQSVLQIKNARFIPAFLPGNVRSASNARPTFCLPPNARSAFC